MFSPIFCVASLLDGVRVLASRAEDRDKGGGVIDVWDIDRKEKLAVWRGHAMNARAIAACPDGGRAVSAGDEGTLRVWDVERGECLGTISGLSAPITVLADGRRALAASDNAIHLVELDSGRIVSSFTGHRDVITSIAPSGAGDRFVSASRDRTVRLWDLTSGRCVRVFTPHRGRAPYVSHSGELDGASATAVAFFPDGDHVVGADGEGTVRCWELEGGTLISSVSVGPTWVLSLAVSELGTVLVGTWDRQVRLWTVGDGETVRIGQHDGEVSGLAFIDDRRAVSCSFDGTVRIWSVVRPACLAVLGQARESGLFPPNVSLW